MDISDAFTETAITGVPDLDEAEETSLHETIKEIYTSNDLPLGDHEIRVGALCFAAGRAYQADQSIVVTMRPATYSAWLDWMIEQATS